MRTSVIICTRNRLKQLLTFVESLSRQDELPSEFVVVDSSDNPLDANPTFSEVIRELPFPCVYVHTSPGLTKQRNKGIEVASGDVLYFFDDDVFLYPDYLSQMNATYRTHPEYGGGMGTPANLPSGLKAKLRVAFARCFLMMHQFGSGRFYKSGFTSFPHGRLSQLGDTEVLSGFMMSIRRSVVEQFAFDGTLAGHSYMEDIDFSRRVSQRYRLFCDPLARLEHRHVYRSVDNSRERRKQFLYNHRYFFEKNFSNEPPWYRFLHWWSIVGMFLKSLVKPPSWFVGYCGALVEYHKNRKQLLQNRIATGS